MASLYQIAADLFKTSPTELDDDTSPRSTEAWDSLKHIELIMVIEREFGVQFEPTEVPALTSLGSIKELLLTKGVTNDKLSGH